MCVQAAAVRAAQVEQHQGRPCVLCPPVVTYQLKERTVVVAILELRVKRHRALTQDAAEVTGGNVVERETAAGRRAAAVRGRQQFFDCVEVMGSNGGPRAVRLDHSKDPL